MNGPSTETLTDRGEAATMTSHPPRRPSPNGSRERLVTAACPSLANSATETPRDGRHRRHEGDTGTFPAVAGGRHPDERALPVSVSRHVRRGAPLLVSLRGPARSAQRPEILLCPQGDPCCRRVRAAFALVILACATGAGFGLVLVAAVTWPNWSRLISELIGAAG